MWQPAAFEQVASPGGFGQVDGQKSALRDVYWNRSWSMTRWHASVEPQAAGLEFGLPTLIATGLVPVDPCRPQQDGPNVSSRNVQ